MDIENEVLCYDHIKIFSEQKKRDESPNNQKLWYHKYSYMMVKEEPWKLQYCESRS
jgi:hypothetical protein